MNKIKFSVAFLIAFIGVGLASCSNGEEGTISKSIPTTNDALTSTTETTIEYDDTLIESGKYMRLDTVYEFNKTNKKLKATQYASYMQYKTNTGEVLFDKEVKYIDYFGKNALYVNYDNKEYYIYINNANNLEISTKKGSVTSTSSLLKLPEVIAEPEYGTYVSGKNTQYKLDQDGKRIPTSEGGYEQEDFYLFVELTETKASLYAGSNASTHNDEPLYSIDNYVSKFVQGKVVIYIPHTNGQYNCNLKFNESNLIEFVNSSENLDGDLKYADYSCSGTMTKI